LAPIGGLGELVDTLVGTLTSRGVRLLPGTRAAKLVPLPSPKCGYRLELDDGDALDASAVILAVPAFAAAELVRELDTALSEQIQSISYASCAIVTLAFRALDVPRPLDAHGYIIPRIEGRPILASSWTSAKWAHRAPADFALLRLFFGRFGDDAMLAGSDAYLLALARGELRDTLGISVAPVLARINRWPRSMPQYTLGHLDRLSTITRRLAHRPGLYLAGAAYHGVGIPDCIGSGETAAEASFKDLRQPS
jgi:oxygen-dependent protoporphyrinogen oxidase